MYVTEQEEFWGVTYGKEYMEKNAGFDQSLGVQGWGTMLEKASDIKSLLECGSNIGRNIDFLQELLPESKKSIIEINKAAFEYVSSRHDLAEKFNGSIQDSSFPLGSFDLVFTMGVLIHIHPDNLLANMRKLYDYSNRYILIGEYFNRTPVMLPYQGEQDKLFKCDFGKLFLENHDVQLVDYGFLWGHLYDSAGFDDITWWLYEKK